MTVTYEVEITWRCYNLEDGPYCYDGLRVIRAEQINVASFWPCHDDEMPVGVAILGHAVTAKGTIDQRAAVPTYVSPRFITIDGPIPTVDDKRRWAECYRRNEADRNRRRVLTAGI